MPDPAIQLLATHDFEYHTDFCKNCGQSKTHIIDRQITCFGGADTKILAMSHLRAAVIADEAERRPQFGRLTPSISTTNWEPPKAS